MRTFKEYYNKALGEHLDWLSHQEEEWWKREIKDELSTKGDYIETVKFLSIDEKNDDSLFYNHTNVRNSEWGILFSMLGQALVDWCCENVKWKDLDAVGFAILRAVDGNLSEYECSVSVYNFDNKKRIKVEDTKELKKFDGCKDFLCEIVDEFITKHGKNIPNDWNYFSFGLDSLMHSCKYGEWVCSSDGYMNFGNYNKETEEYDKFVECM